MRNLTIKEATELLIDDEVVAIPTETVYGLAADARNDAAVTKIFKAKGRPSDNPLIVHIGDVTQIDSLVTDVSEGARLLMDHFWPGPLTIILPSAGVVSELVTAGLSTVGLRMPAHEVALQLLRMSGIPLAAPSANISGKPSGTNITDIFKELNNKVDAIVDGGNTDIGIESTVVQVVGNSVNILRPGKISREDIESLNLKVLDDKINENVSPEEKALAPGMKYKHYAPNSKAVLVYSLDNEKLVSVIRNLIIKNKNVVVISSKENEDKYNGKVLVMGSKNNLSEISKNIFSLLRKADEFNPDIIIIEGVDNNRMGTAIMNRLIKACSYNFIDADLDFYGSKK